MTTTLTTKLAALMLALAINSVIMGGVALMFNAKTHQLSSLTVTADGVARQIDRASI
jgi:hypothetical protein